MGRSKFEDRNVKYETCIEWIGRGAWRWRSPGDNWLRSHPRLFGELVPGCHAGGRFSSRRLGRFRAANGRHAEAFGPDATARSRSCGGDDDTGNNTAGGFV
jgi:hypothetical protein